jgi:hypothetical protein
MTQSIAIAIGYPIKQIEMKAPGLELDRFKLKLDMGLELGVYRCDTGEVSHHLLSPQQTDTKKPPPWRSSAFLHFGQTKQFTRKAPAARLL